VADWPVEVADHDPGWSLRYLEVAGELRGRLSDDVVAIEHIGSTAVPGLPAKPLIDVLVGVRSLDGVGPDLAVLADRGFVHVPDHEAVMPYRRYLYRYRFRHDGSVDRVHLHLVERTHPFFTEHVALRDYLRVHPGESSRYGALKRQLAATTPPTATPPWTARMRCSGS
jgi:GrpB-like predicted nucleotidyltransferase (UPF0157 family)